MAGENPRSFRSEGELRRFVVRHARPLLHVAVLASEFPVHGDGDARIDAVTMDSTHRPVIIEFKRVASDTAICQGLYYLDWLTHHRERLTELVAERIGPRAARRIDWSAPRVLCIAEASSEREEAVARQIGRQVELIAVHRLSDGLVLLQHLAVLVRPDSAYQ
jgi:hypothetical protein